MENKLALVDSIENIKEKITSLEYMEILDNLAKVTVSADEYVKSNGDTGNNDNDDDTSNDDDNTSNDDDNTSNDNEIEFERMMYFCVGQSKISQIMDIIESPEFKPSDHPWAISLLMKSCLNDEQICDFLKYMMDRGFDIPKNILGLAISSHSLSSVKYLIEDLGYVPVNDDMNNIVSIDVANYLLDINVLPVTPNIIKQIISDCLPFYDDHFDYDDKINLIERILNLGGEITPDIMTTALEWLSSHNKMFLFLVSKGGRFNKSHLINALNTGNVGDYTCRQIVKIIIENIDDKNSIDASIVKQAIFYNYVDIVRILIDGGYVKVTDDIISNAISEGGYFGLLEYLIKKKRRLEVV
jgi:hypothetical protein